jgi:hypothetical protein
MIRERRSYCLSKDQPILREARRRKSRTARDRMRLEVEFWKNFSVEKLARWEGTLRKPAVHAA